MDETKVGLLSALVGPCPQCGNGQLEAVSDGELANFLCQNCGCCWHGELQWVNRVNPANCPGCESRPVCLAAKREYGEKVGLR